jgi:hypothetical protein
MAQEQRDLLNGAKRIGSSSCLIAAASLGHAPLHAIHPASDKEQHVDFDVCAAAAFYT